MLLARKHVRTYLHGCRTSSVQLQYSDRGSINYYDVIIIIATIVKCFKAQCISAGYVFSILNAHSHFLKHLLLLHKFLLLNSHEWNSNRPIIRTFNIYFSYVYCPLSVDIYIVATYNIIVSFFYIFPICSSKTM